MVSSRYSPSTSPLQPKRSNRPLSELSSRIHIFRERQERDTMSESKQQETTKGSLAYLSCVNCHPYSTSTQEDWSTRTGNDDDDDDIHSSKSTTIQRMCRNIHRKRDAWQQMALRCRHAANPHQRTLQILKEAARRAKASGTPTEDITSSSETSDETVSAKALLHQVRASALVQEHAKSMELKTAVTKVQALYRGYITRRHTSISKRQDLHEPLVEIDATNNQLPTTFQPTQLSFSHLKRLAPIERQCSDITMSDLGDSTHHTQSVDTRVSFRNPSRCIQEGKVEESSDDESDVDDREPFRTRCDRQRSLEKNNQGISCQIDVSGSLNQAIPNRTPRTNAAKRYQMKESPSLIPAYQDTSGHGDCWEGKHHSSSNLPVRTNPSYEDIRISCAMSHASHSSYFSTTPRSPNNGFSVREEQPHSSPPRTSPVTPKTSYMTPQAGSQALNDYIDSMLEEEVDDDRTNDDDVSLAASFFEEEPRSDKDSLDVLHRSDGSLDLRSTLKKKSGTFRDLKGKNGPSCFHLSLSTSSRWDGALPDPITVSQLPQHDQAAVAKAAISTYLPVRPPPRKLTPTKVMTTPSNGASSDYNNSFSTIFSSAESTEPSPQMPLRKASTHGTSRIVSRTSKESDTATKSSFPVPPPPSYRSGRLSAMMVESSPQLPIRKTSLHQYAVHTRLRDNATRSSVEVASPPDTAETHSMRRTRALMNTSGSSFEDGPIRQPERKSSSFVVDDTPVRTASEDDDMSMIIDLNSPSAAMDDHPIRLPVRKLSAMTLNSSTHHSSETPRRPPETSPQGNVSSSMNDTDAS